MHYWRALPCKRTEAARLQAHPSPRYPHGGPDEDVYRVAASVALLLVICAAASTAADASNFGCLHLSVGVPRLHLAGPEASPQTYQLPLVVADPPTDSGDQHTFGDHVTGLKVSRSQDQLTFALSQ